MEREKRGRVRAKRVKTNDFPITPSSNHSKYKSMLCLVVLLAAAGVTLWSQAANPSRRSCCCTGSTAAAWSTAVCSPCCRSALRPGRWTSWDGASPTRATTASVCVSGSLGSSTLIPSSARSSLSRLCLFTTHTRTFALVRSKRGLSSEVCTLLRNTQETTRTCLGQKTRDTRAQFGSVFVFHTANGDTSAQREVVVCVW